MIRSRLPNLGTLPRPLRGLARWMVVFVALSALDFFLTWRLLQTTHLSTFEANPIAALVLEQFGWLGMGLLKLASLTVVLGVVVVLSRWRPAIGRRLLVLCCMVVLAVVGYSGVLPWLPLQDAEEQRLLAQAQSRSEQLHRDFKKSKQFNQKTNELAEALALRQLPLDQAVVQLEHFLEEIDYDPLPRLRFRVKMKDDQACLAATLVLHAGHVLHQHPELEQRHLPNLAQAFERRFHCRLPIFAQEPPEDQRS